MRIWKVWSAGWIATGERGGPICHGEVKAETAEEAILTFFSEFPSKYFDRERMTFWGCELSAVPDDGRIEPFFVEYGPEDTAHIVIERECVLALPSMPHETAEIVCEQLNDFATKLVNEKAAVS